jgi:Putative beta-barrel porin-2, OmpL-like. bbp2
MFDAFCLSVALAVGQGSPVDPTLEMPPELPRAVALPNVKDSSLLTAPVVPSNTKMVADMQVRPAQAVLPPSADIRPMPPSLDLARPMPPSLTAPSVPGRAVVGEPLPTRVPAALPTMTVPGTRPVQAMPVMRQAPATPMTPPAATAPATNGAPAVASSGAACNTCEKAEEEKKEPEKGHFMKLVEGTCFGSILDEHKISVSGWTAMSFNTASSGQPRSSFPVVWADRKNQFLLQQHWVDISKNIDTESRDFDWGFKIAGLVGSDYRYTVVRGLFDAQLRNSRPDAKEINGQTQNVYGADLPLFYMNFWLPGCFEGTEVQVGRMFTPFGYESVMATATPLMSRSYAFNFAPPFFHTGISINPKFSDTLSGKFMAVNGNDVFFDGSDEWRFVGALTKTFNDGDDSLTFGTSLGRGKFNANRPTPVSQNTIGLAWEPAGRNNINVFDLVYTHKVSDDLNYAFEAIYGYQTNVPSGATGLPGLGTNFNGGAGTAHWVSVVNYLTYTFSDELSGILRYEMFNDIHGQRTGFEGLYCATTLGLQIKPCDSVIIRPEVRYDHNSYSTPFGGRHGIFTAGTDLIIKW